jgi:hypothetical protein
VTITVTTNAGTIPVRLNVNNANGNEVAAARTYTSGAGQSYTLGTVTTARTIAIVNNDTGAVIGTFTHSATVPSTPLVLVQPPTGSTTCPEGKTPTMGEFATGRNLYINGALMVNLNAQGIKLGWGGGQVTTNSSGAITEIVHSTVTLGVTLCLQ